MKSRIVAAAAVVAGALALAAPAGAQPGDAAKGDAAKGEQIFNTQCKSCHTLERGGASAAGPNLYAVFGRMSGTARGYGYSEVMRQFAIVWNDETLARYLRNPKADMPGTKMMFAGLRRKDQIDDLIAYLKEATR
jgi:cytochrome c